MRLLQVIYLSSLAASFAISHVVADDPQSNPANPNIPNQLAPVPDQTGVQNPAMQNPAQNPAMSPTDRTLLIKSLPSKKLVGAKVDNLKGENLGTVDDLVIDLQSGKVAYVALSVGGVLGIGDKLFAVPYEEFRTAHDSNNNISFVLDASKERLENAPGFDKNHWPDFASPEWRNQIDTYYRHSSATRPAGEQPVPQNR